LQRAIDSYANNLQWQYEHRDSPEKLTAQDDKHLFTEKGLKSLSQQVGFRNLEVVAMWHLSPPGDIRVGQVQNFL
jgi:hypothetical protein